MILSTIINFSLLIIHFTELWRICNEKFSFYKNSLIIL